MDTVAVSVVIPTCGRAGVLRGMLRRLFECAPAPAEILVQIDAADTGTGSMLETEFAGVVSWEQSKETTGPGGGRNVLIGRARYPLVVSFDDDSWPEDRDFFARAATLAERYPKAAVLACSTRVKGRERDAQTEEERELANFENCGCVIRKEAFEQIGGYVPLRYAYGMEEVDVALQLLDRGWSIRYAPGLRVYHDTEMNHHPSAAVNAAHIRNTGLLAFLRYPPHFWPLGARQVANRVRYAIHMRRFAGIVSGVLRIPAACWRYRRYRKVVLSETVKRSRGLR
jgi:GT2 family glycosyltransferase